MNLADMPPRMRKAAAAALARDLARRTVPTTPPSRRDRTPDDAGRVPTDGPRPVGRYQCGACDALSRSYAAAQRHADTAGHARIGVVL